MADGKQLLGGNAHPPELMDDDAKIAHCIRVFDRVGKDVNTLARGVREWYGRHFPELANIVQDSLIYVKTVSIMGTRDNAAGLRFSEVLPELEEVEAELKEAARTSSGAEDNDELYTSLVCRPVLFLSESRELIHDNLRIRMNTAAPNLTALVGELIGARLIACAGGRANLRKMDGRRIETLGPGRRGLIYDAPLVKQASTVKAEGKMARSLAARSALAVCRDVSLSGTDKDNSYGLENRAELEEMLRNPDAEELGRSAEDKDMKLEEAARAGESVLVKQQEEERRKRRKGERGSRRRMLGEV